MFAGLFQRRPLDTPAPSVDLDVLSASLTPHHTPDRRGKWRQGPFLAVGALTFNTPESRHETIPFSCPRTGDTILAWARLDNRDELIEALGDGCMRDGRAPDSLTDPALILAAYHAWGPTGVQRLEGDFAFVILSPAAGKVYAARDSAGAKPFYYLLDRDHFSFATSVASFHRMAQPLALNEAWMLRYLANRSMSFTDTALAEVRKLPPGHWLEVERETHRLERYHRYADTAPWAWERDKAWVEAYRRWLERVSRDRLRSAYAIGVESSGGLDSSTLAALIAHLNPQARDSLHSFGFAHYEDEPEYALATSQRHLLGYNHVLTGFPEEDPLDRVLDVLGQPPEQLSAISHAPFYRLCAGLGIRTLLSGFGGDEAVTNSGGLLLRELADRRAWLALMREMPGPWWQRPPRFALKARQYTRRDSHNPALLASLLGHLRHLPLKREAMEQHALEAVFKQEAEYDAPYRSINGFVLGNRLGAHVPNRLENCALLAASHGVDYRWPLLDRRLIEQYLATPAIEKYAAGMGRYLHRRAVTDLLPEAVCWKQSKRIGANLLLRNNWAEMFPRLLPHARRLSRDNHPVLDSLLDREAITRMLTRAETGGGDSTFNYAFLYFTRHWSWLDAWLRRYFP